MLLQPGWDNNPKGWELCVRKCHLSSFIYPTYVSPDQATKSQSYGFLLTSVGLFWHEGLLQKERIHALRPHRALAALFHVCPSCVSCGVTRRVMPVLLVASSAFGEQTRARFRKLIWISQNHFPDCFKMVLPGKTWIANFVSKWVWEYCVIWISTHLSIILLNF